jgi:hypothetical protein
VTGSGLQPLPNFDSMTHVPSAKHLCFPWHQNVHVPAAVAVAAVTGSGLQPLPNGDSMTSVPSSNNSATGLKPTTSTDSPGLSDKDLARGQADVSQLLACAGQLAVWLLVSGQGAKVVLECTAAINAAAVFHQCFGRYP